MAKCRRYFHLANNDIEKLFLSRFAIGIKDEYYRLREHRQRNYHPAQQAAYLPVFPLVGLYAASTAAVMSVLPFYIREMGGGSPLYHWNHHRHSAFSHFVRRLISPPSDRATQANTDCHAGYCGDKSTITRQRAQCIRLSCSPARF